MQLKKYFYIIIMLALSLPLFAQEGVSCKCATENSELFALRQESLWNLQMLVRMCHRETDGLFKTAGIPKRTLNFYALEREFSEDEFTGSSVAVPSNESAHRGVWRVFQAMVARRLRECCQTRLPKEPSCVTIVAAALANRVVYCGLGATGVYRRDFRIPRMQFSWRRFPPLAHLVSGPAPFSDGALFRVYLVHCNLLLDILEGTTRNLPELLAEWALAECRDGLPPLEALKHALPEGSLMPGETMQAWYERNALALVNDRVVDDSVEALQQRLEELMTVSFLSADSQDGIMRVHLERLPELSRDYHWDSAALGEVQNGLMRLLPSVPPLLQEAVGKYISAVDALRQGVNRDFRERLYDGRHEFESASVLQAKAEEMLDEAEEDDERALRMHEWLETLKRRNALNAIDKMLFN